jgi:hypothetical protein
VLFTRNGTLRSIGRVTSAVLACVAAACLTSCQMRSTAASENAKAGPRAGVVFCIAKAFGCVPASAFSAAADRELTIRTSTVGIAPGNHTERIEIVGPDGSEYPETRTGFRVLEGSKEPVPETRTISIAEMRTSQRRFTGSWMVRVFLDGHLLATQNFEMRP